MKDAENVPVSIFFLLSPTIVVRALRASVRALVLKHRLLDSL